MVRGAACPFPRRRGAGGGAPFPFQGDRLRQFGDAVHDAQHGTDGGGIGATPVGTNLGQHILGSMAQPLETRKIEKTAASLHRMEEAENGIQPVAVRRVRFPGDDLSGQRLQRFLRFGYEFLK